MDVGIYFLIIMAAIIIIAIIFTIFFCCKKNLSQYFHHLSNSFDSVTNIPGGLINSSTDCYMNASIQALVSSGSLIKELEHLKSRTSRCPSLTCFLELANGINENGHSKENSSLNTVRLDYLVTLIQWSKPFQQDANEFIMALIKAIHDEVTSSQSELVEMPLKPKMVQRFYGMGMECEDRLQYYIGLNLELCGDYSSERGVSLDYLVDHHFQLVPIDGDPTKSIQCFYYRSAPTVLLLHIQANKWNQMTGTRVKPKYRIRYQKQMKLWLDIVPELNERADKEEVLYQIKAVVHHSGSVSSGHYVANRYFHDEWYHVNDDRVYRVPFTTISDAPYIFIYERIENSE